MRQYQERQQGLGCLVILAALFILAMIAQPNTEKQKPTKTQHGSPEITEKCLHGVKQFLSTSLANPKSLVVVHHSPSILEGGKYKIQVSYKFAHFDYKGLKDPYLLHKAQWFTLDKDFSVINVVDLSW